MSLFGVPIDPLTLEGALARVEDAIATRTRLQIGVVNAAKLVGMQRDASLRDDVLRCDMILADGMSVVWASRLLRQPLPERVAGIDLMLAMLRRGARLGWRVFCLGATEEVLERAVARIAADYPGLTVVGRRNGYFQPAQDREVAAQVAAARPDILLVAMTSPKKESFLARFGPELGVPVCHGVGGSFDVMAGRVRRAPKAWQRVGMEWLFRVLQEPGRLWRRYLDTNLAFCRMVAGEWLARRRR